MAENMIKFLRGDVANLPANATEGAVYFTKDEGVYLGLGDGTYHRYGDFIAVSNVDALPVAGAHETCMYYCIAENILAKWNGSAWVQINKQKTLAELGGVAQSVYSAKIAALEKADTDNAAAIEDLKGYVGTIPEGYSETNVVAYINKKAEETLNAASGGSSESAASVLAALNTYKAENDSKVKANTDAIDAIEADYLKAADKTELSGLIAAEKERAEGIEAGLQAAVDAAKKAGDDAQTDVDALEAKIGTVTEGKTVVQMITEAQTAATYDDTAVKDRISAIENDYLKGEDKTALETAIAAAKKAGDDAQSDIDAFLAAAEIGDAAIDTLKEIQDYIESDGAAATEMTNKISTLGGRLDVLEAIDHSAYAKAADVTASQSAQDTKIDANAEAIAALNGTGDGSVSKKISDAITDANLGQYAKQTDLETHAGDTDIHITAAERITWNAAQSNAETTAAAALASARTEITAEIDADVAALANGQVKTNADAIAANAKAITDGDAAVEAKVTALAGNTYTKAEVEALIAQSQQWGEF